MLARRLRPLRLAAFATLALAACGGGGGTAEGAQQGGRGTPGGGGGGGGGGRGPGGPGGFPGGRDAIRPVEVGTVERGSLARTSTVSGVLEPIRTVGVNAQLAGALTSVRVEEGDVVRVGQVLAEVDAREIAAQLRSAEANLALARSTADRSARLARDRIVTEAEVERDQAALIAAQATVDGARARVGYATVRAPAAGVITEKRVEAGDVVQGQTRLFTVADVSTLVARVQVSELDVAGVTVGEAADVSIDALSGAGFRGTVRRVFPAADTTTRMVPVEVALSGGAARSLRPGYMARVTFQLGARSGVLLAPSSAVVGTDLARAVFVVEGTRAVRKPVQIGRPSGDRVEVLSGLVGGETVVVAGADDLRDGATVRVVRPVGSPGGDGAAPIARVNGAGVPAAPGREGARP